MTDETVTLAGYRLRRADESLKEAELLLGGGHVNTFVNRLYYACFYAVSGLLLLEGEEVVAAARAEAERRMSD